MRVVILAAPSLACDAMRIALLASHAFSSVEVATSHASLQARLGAADCVVSDGSLAHDASVMAQVNAAGIRIVHASSTATIGELVAAICATTVVPGGQVAPALSAARPLSRRELQVVGHLAAGLTNREIGALLAISIKTVDTHRGQILKKLGLRNNADLTRFALRNGLVLTPTERPTTLRG